MARAGFKVLAAIDSAPDAIATLQKNLPSVPYPLQKDLITFTPQDLARIIGDQSVDVIIGGPPCQGFSVARQRDGSNHGNTRRIPDKRRHLYKYFLRYVAHFHPKVFVMENVLGMRSAAGGLFFDRVQKESRALGYRVHSQTENSWDLGVPQKRHRQLIIGVRDSLAGYFPSDLSVVPRAQAHPSLGAAIWDLPILRAGGGKHQMAYQTKRRKQSIKTFGEVSRRYLYKVLEVSKTKKITNHVARPHSDRDLRDFAKLLEGESSAVAERERKVQFEFPYDRSSFKDRYTRQSRRKPCSTIVAHLSKDGLMFIHPTQNRSLTPREAARVQSFPDWFEFPESRTYAYRLIGNAVPPLVGESVGQAVKIFLAKSEHKLKKNVVRRIRSAVKIPDIPATRTEASERLLSFSYRHPHKLRRLSKEEFLRGWRALLFLFPGLHPDNALDHGSRIANFELNGGATARFCKFVRRRFTRSGWPIALRWLGKEAWRRFGEDQLTADEFYCNIAHAAGLQAENGSHSDEGEKELVESA